jgi:hypothetical protein
VTLFGTLLGGLATILGVALALVFQRDTLRAVVSRALTPHVLVACLIAGAGGMAYGRGAPVGVFYAAIVLAVLSALPGYEHWESKRGE